MYQPRAIRLLSLHGSAAFYPKFEFGKYVAPLISKRIAANLRKRAIIDGTFGSFSSQCGGWDPLWDKPKKVFMLRPFKGHLRERDRSIRANKITTAMKAMPERFLKHKQENENRKPKKDFLYMFKRVAEISRGGGGGDRRPEGTSATKIKTKKK